jgi:hypothetical protein
VFFGSGGRGPNFGGLPWLAGNKKDNVLMQPGLGRGAMW